ncbi:hypothetical protein TrVE_jg12416 [Triparma verrucosa]|uniref:EamA domain-containing protein n=1 Tax=Triparma verrucosa TaxID=1606542 RepID=A0A9W7F7A6_9STRA|nr:hypothetical protein TrVE_jg12416 [Triparma verrucosa]
MSSSVSSSSPPLPLYTLGLLYLLLITLIWSLSSLLVSSTLPTFPSPLLTYLSTFPFTLLLKKSEIKSPHLPTIKLSTLLGSTWYLSNLFYYLSLQKTSVTSSTVLSTSSSLITYIIETYLNEERYDIRRLACVGLVIAGAVVSASIGDGGGGEMYPKKYLGDFYGFVSAVGYSFYTVIVKRFCVEGKEEGGYEKVRGGSCDGGEEVGEVGEAREQVQEEDGEKEEKFELRLTLGYMGLMTSLLGFIVIPYYAVTGTNVEMTWTILGSITYVALIDNLLSDYLWAKSVVYTSATVATVGLALTVPVAVLIDWIEGGGVGWARLVGSGLVVVGFVGINI